MNDLLLSLAMAALSQLGGYGAAPGMGGGTGAPMGVPLPYGGYPGSGPAPVYPGGITPGTGYQVQGYPRGGFPGQGTRLVPGYPTTAMPQGPSSAGPAPSSEAEAFGLAPYR